MQSPWDNVCVCACAYSKPVMDVLVILCARYHLNPSDHVIELLSTNQDKLKFKPSSLIGSLEAELVMLKPKRGDVRKAPNMPVVSQDESKPYFSSSACSGCRSRPSVL